MNFYDFHIGDYASRTAHLEPMEDLAYRRLLDLYYVREGALPHELDRLSKLIRLRGHEDAIESVLEEFFELDEERGWVHRKCEEVIAAAVDKRNKARASADKRWGNADAMPSQSGRNANAMPAQSEGNAPSPTSQSHSHSQENPPTPRKRGKSFDPKAIELPGWLAPAVWFEWCDDRAERGKPVTERGAKKQLAQLADYEKQGFSAESVVAHSIAGSFQGLYPPPKKRMSPADVARATVPAATGPDPALKKIEADRAQAKPPPEEVRAKLQELRRAA